MTFDLQTDNADLLAVLSRVYDARLDLQELEALGLQTALFSDDEMRLKMPGPFKFMNRYNVRTLITAVAVVLGLLAAENFMFISTDYWRGAVLGMFALFLGALAWAYERHARRRLLLAQRLQAQLELVKSVRSGLDNVADELEALLMDKSRSKLRQPL